MKCYVEASDDEPSSPQLQDIPRPLKQRSNGKKVIKKSISKCTNYIFNSAPKLLKKIKRYNGLVLFFVLRDITVPTSHSKFTSIKVE